MIKLGIEQEVALEAILKFIKSDKIAFSLSGFAGTGKSFLVKELINKLDELNENYTICAPTHKAKVVLERFTGKEGLTLHKLLSLSPNINLLDLDFRYLQFFNINGANFFPYDSIIICDESSMINDDLFDLLIKQCITNKCKIVFCGDIKQIKPVNASHSSKVFELEDKIFLTEIFRQNHDSALNDILPISREEFIPSFTTNECKNGSLYVYTQPRDFFMEAIPYFKKAIENLDILETKILSYTNDRANFFNSKMQEALFGLKNEYNKFEFLTGYENLKFDGCDFWNSMDYIITEEPEKIEIFIPNVGFYPGWRLRLYDSSNKVTNTVSILSKYIEPERLNLLTSVMESYRLEAIELKKKGSRASGLKWKEYYKMMNSFTTPADLYYDNRLIRKKSFDLGYASTLHKS